MRAVVLSAAFCILGAGCSRALVIDEETPAIARENDVICVKEFPMGSHMAVKRCTTAAQREAARQQAEASSEEVGGKRPGASR